MKGGSSGDPVWTYTKGKRNARPYFFRAFSKIRCSTPGRLEKHRGD
jgi:hypothetical protein